LDKPGKVLFVDMPHPKRDIRLIGPPHGRRR
jgi:hypothetical protein